MKLLALHLENFRGIARADLSFDASLTALEGINGAGKTTILEALSLLLRLIVQPPEEAPVEFAPGKIGRPVPTTKTFDVREGCATARVAVELVLFGRTLRCGATLTALDVTDARGVAMVDPDAGLLDAQATFARKLREPDPVPLPAFAYYSDRRHLKPLNPAKTEEQPHRLQRPQAYVEALRGYAEFLEWLLARESYENELIRDAPERRDHQLEAVRKAIAIALPHLTELRVRRSTQKITVTKDGVPLDVAELSAGERSTLLLFADVARRLAMAAPDSREPLRTEGVVLIDEVELHLHPQWQREVLPRLLEAFPRVQFVVTTHSPQVLSTVDAGRIRALRREADGSLTVTEPPNAFGRTSDVILETVFEVSERPGWAKQLLHQAYVAVREDRLDDAKRLRNELASRLGEDEPELGRLDILINRAEARHRA